MCIIAVKTAGKIISADILKRMFAKNPDGAGVAWYNSEEKLLHIRKGFFKLDDFLQAVDKIPLESPALIHCRIKTHGKVRAGLCHPFPVSDKIPTLETSRYDSNGGYVFAHNGVISDLPLPESDKDVSDTEALAVSVLSPLASVGDLLDPKWDDIINSTIEYSRVAIMDSHGRIKIYGNGWSEDGGVYYSNNGYKEPVVKYTYPKGENYYYSGWDDGYDSGYGYGYDDYSDRSWGSYWDRKYESNKSHNKSKSKSKSHIHDFRDRTFRCMVSMIPEGGKIISDYYGTDNREIKISDCKTYAMSEYGSVYAKYSDSETWRLEYMTKVSDDVEYDFDNEFEITVDY